MPKLHIILVPTFAALILIRRLGRFTPLGFGLCVYIPSGLELCIRILGRFAPSGFELRIRILGRFAPSSFVLRICILSRFARSGFAFSFALLPWASYFALSSTHVLCARCATLHHHH